MNAYVTAKIYQILNKTTKYSILRLFCFIYSKFSRIAKVKKL